MADGRGLAAEAEAVRRGERVAPAVLGHRRFQGVLAYRGGRRVHLVRHPAVDQTGRLALHQAGVQLAGDHVRVGQQPPQETGVGGHPEGDRLRQRGPQPAQRARPVGAVGDDLGEHRVVAAADLHALGQTGVRAQPVALHLVEREHRAAGRQEVAGRVLGADPRLDGVPGEGDVLLGEGEMLAGRDPQLPLHQVETGDELGDRVLDLEAGVHLHEEVRGGVLARDDELDGAGAAVAAGTGRLHGRLAHRGAGRLVQQDRGGLLDDLLVAALEGALALAEVDDVAVAVGQDLDLDVPGPVDPALDEQGVVAEGGAGLAAGGGDLVGQQRLVADQPHTLAAAARGRLEQHRHADLPGRGGQLAVVQPAARGAGDDRDAGLAHRLLGPDLVAHQLDGLGGRADEDQPGVRAGAGEGGVLGEEAVARMDCLGAGPGGRVQQPFHGQIALGGRGRTDPYGGVGLPHVPGVGVRVAEDGDRADAEGAQRTDDTDRDLAAVGDEHGVEIGGHCWGHPSHIRKTP